MHRVQNNPIRRRNLRLSLLNNAIIGKTALKPSERLRPNFENGKLSSHRITSYECHRNREPMPTLGRPLSVKRKREERLTADSGIASPHVLLTSDFFDSFTPNISPGFNALLENVFLSPLATEVKIERKSSGRKKSKQRLSLFPPDIHATVLTPRTRSYPDEFCKSFVRLKDDGEKHQLLGKGTFGCVFLGVIRGTKVAAKVCPKYDCECCGEKNGLSASHNNVVLTHRVLALDLQTTGAILSQPNVRAFLNVRKDNFSSRGMQIVVMEYAGDQSLQRLIDDITEALSAKRRNKFLIQIALALEHIHSKRIVHLDLKPTNIMISCGDVCKLVDFGCSQRLDGIRKNESKESLSANSSPHSLCVGTVCYAAPELFKRAQPTFNCDIYSLGIIMWQLVTREIPFAKCAVDSIIYRVSALQTSSIHVLAIATE